MSTASSVIKAVGSTPSDAPRKSEVAAAGFALDTMLLTPEAAAYQLSISRTALFSLLKAGELESVKIGASRRIPREALARYVEQLRAAS